MLIANRASTEVIDVFIDLNKGTVYLSSYIVERERKGAQCTCRRMEKAPKIGRQLPCSGQ
jgi:hypothetical protein